MKTDTPWFEQATRFARTYFSWMVRDSGQSRRLLKKHFSSDYRELLQFTGLAVEPIDVLRLSYTGAFLSFFMFLFVDFFILLIYRSHLGEIDILTVLLMGGATIFIPFLVMNLIARYPKTYAQYMKIHSLGDIPEILSYLVMFLKLVPNLENSVKFAASESSTSLARDLRKLVWDLEIRVYHGIDDALISFANTWGHWSEYFKRSLHLIRSSVQEREETSRVVTLNRALDISLDGTREVMNQFAGKLQQPTLVIYSLGVMIPLALVAMLPATGLVGIHITIFHVFFLYDIFLPMVLFLYMRKILLSRPATFNPPVVPCDHPDLCHIRKRRCLVLACGIGACVAIPGLLFLVAPFFSPSSDIFSGFFGGEQGLGAFVPVTLSVIWGVAVAVSLYTYSVYRPYKKVRDSIKQMEKEFSDALYILGKRIAEEKSPEESFMYTAITMGDAQIADVFHQTGYTLTAMHTNLRDALFSPEFGSLRYVYSYRVKAILRLFVEGIQKSQRAVSISLVKIADHLKELQEVENKCKESLSGLTSVLRSTVALFAPLIAGITLAITKLISTIIQSMHEAFPSETIVETPTVLSSVTSAFTIENIRPEYFVLVIGIYVVELVFLLTRFTNGIDEGDDHIAFMYSLGKAMPTAVTVLTITIIAGQLLFSSLAQTIA